MNNSSKANNEDTNKFPWAKSLVKDLKVGNIVYVTNIKNEIDSYIVLGVDAYNPKNQQTTDSIYNVDGSNLLELTMPIIIHNEVSISTNDWPDNISDEKYRKVLGNDNGAWSIGLIQWNASRAYDLLLKISNNDTDWRNAWLNKNYDLYNDLNTNSSSARSKYGKGFTLVAKRNENDPTEKPEDSELTKQIRNMLNTEKAKSTQRDYASEDTQSSITKVQEKGVTNPMIIIFLVDIMNQYGPNLPSTIQNAASISKNGGDIKSQFNEFVKYCEQNLGNYSTYENRRTTTKTYVEQLYEQGKFSSGGLAENLGVASSYGFIFPIAGCNWNNNVSPNSKSKFPSYYNKSGSPHTGLDIGQGGVNGKQVVAVAAGKVILSKATKNASGAYISYGEQVVIDHLNGLCTQYGHMQPNSRKVAVGDTVQQGQILGLVGTTGNSTGPHLHFEVRKGSNQTGNTNYLDPRPYLPK